MAENANSDEAKAKRIAELARQIREAEGELRKLAPGELYSGTQDRELESRDTSGLSGPTPNRLTAEQHAAILDAIPAHVALLDNHGVILAVNAAWRRFATANVLQSSDFFVGQSYLATCESAHGECADEAQAVATGIRKVLSGETKEFGIEYPCHSPSERRWFRLMVTPLSETPGMGAVVMHVNVTQRRLAEEILSQREREQRELAEKLTIETLRLHESQAVANVGSWETDLATFKVTWTDETHRIFETNPEEFEVTHRGFLERVHPDDRERVDAAFLASIGVPGPFAIEHRLLFPDGRIKFVEERWQSFTDATGKPVRAVGTCQDNTRQVAAHAELVQSEERFRRLFEKVPDAIQLVDTQGVILDVNPATEMITGYPRKELVGRNFLGLRLLEEEDLSRAKENLMRNAEGRGTGPSEYTVHCKDGTIITMEFEGFPIRIGGQDLVLGMGRDITERKQAERRLARISRLYLVLSRINEAIVRTKEKRSLFETACKIVTEDGGLRMAAVMAIDAEKTFVLPVAHAGYEEEFFSGVSINLLDPALNRGTIGTAIRTGRHDICNDTFSEQRMSAWRERFMKHDFRSTASFPIREGGSVMGALVVFSEEADYFLKDEVELLASVAEDITFAIEMLRSETALHERQTLLASAERIGRMGCWNFDVRTDRLFWSQTTAELFGIAPADFRETFEHFYSFIIPEDRPSYEGAIARVTVENMVLEAEYRVQRPDGEVRWMYERGHVEFDVTGIQIRRLGMVMDITERRQTETERNRIFNLSLDLLSVGNFEGKLEQVNPAWTECLGWSAVELANRSWLDFVHPEDHAATIRTQAEICAGRVIRNFENRYRCKDGSYRWLSWNSHPLTESRQIFGVARDVTERRKNEEQLRLLETCVSRFNDIVLITEAEPIDDPGPRILYVNDAFVRRTGFTREEAIGKTPRLLQGPKTQRDALDRIRAALKAWKPVREELINYTKSGEEFWLELDIVPIADATGWFTHWVSIERDVTERKRTQEVLAESQRQYRDLVETSHNVIWTVDLEGRFTFLNQASRAVFGRDPEEMIGRRFHEFVPEDQHQANDEIFARMLREGRDVIDYSNRICRKDGSIAILNSNARIILDAQGQMIGISGMSQDTTEVVRAQEAIAQSEARFRGLFDQAAVGMCIASTEGIFLRTNERFCEIVGYSAEEILERDCVKTTHPDDREREAKTVARMLAGDLQTAAWEKRYIHKDGHAVWCNLTLSLLPGGGEQSRQFVAVIEDITERRAAIEQLRHREQLLRIAGKVARMGGWSVDFPEVRITWSDEVCAIHDMPAGTVPALDQALGFYTPESRPVIESAFSLCASEGTPFDVELEVLTAKGRRAWVRSIGQAERDKAGTIRRVQGAFQDITGQKKAEAEALRSAETLAGIVQVQQEIANADLPLPEIMHLMAERAQMLTGATGGAVEIAEGSEMVYAAGAGVVADIVGMRLKREGSLSGLATNTGAVLCCDDTETDPRVDLPACRRIGVRSMIVAPLRVGEKIIGVLKVLSGEPQGFKKRDVNNLQILVETLGVVIQRQRAAEALRESVEEFRTLAEVMPQIVWVTRPDGWTIYFNQHWMIYTGLTLDESLGHGWSKPFHPEDQQRAWDAWQLATSTVATYTLECRLRRADGEYRWWLIRGEPQKDAEGKVLKWFGTCTDIDALKNAEIQVTSANRALKMLSACNEALIHVEAEDTLLRQICQIAVEVGGYRMAWVGYAQSDVSRSIRPMSWAGAEEGYLTEIQQSLREDDFSGQGPVGRAIRENQIVLCEDIEAVSSFHWVEAARKRGYGGVICLPLSSDERVFGVLSLYSSQVTRTPAEEHRLLRELADDLAFGIQTLRSRIEKQKMQQAVISIASGVSSTVGGAFFSGLVRHTIEALHADAGFLAVLEAPESPSARTITAIIQSGEIDNFDYSLKGTPCEQVVLGHTCLVEQNVQAQYPEDKMLAVHRIEAYAGTPLLNSQGAVIGLISVLFQKPIVGEQFIPSTLQIFAARAASELERQKSDQQLREQAALLDAAHDAIFVKDLEDRVLYWNKGAERLYGWASKEVVGRKVSSFLHSDLAEVEGAIQKVLKNDRWEGELHKIGKEGNPFLVQASWTLLRDSDGKPTSVLAINSDLTEKKKLEAQFLRAQRMESIGTLAGGIAHDLNNVLAPIMMSVELLKLTCTSEQDQNLLATLLSSVKRGANLVSKVLGFARGVEGQRIPVNIGHLISELVRVMQETFPRNITIEYESSANLWSVVGDPTQIHQVILNLCVNARDAMPNGGKLTISAANIVLDDTYASMNLNARPGSYVVLRVEDSGTGIPPELMERIFEPFFTTKEMGKGTGLGLSTTMAIVKSHSGFINHYSEVGKGTKFKVYFPANASKEASEEQSIEQTRLPRGKGELILVVDDEESIRNVAKSTLERFGYSVMVAAHGAEAIVIYLQNQSAIAVILTDMAMPIMDGPALIIALKSINPKVRIIGSSGLSSNGGNAKAVGAGVEHFIPKPYTAETMLKSIRAILDCY